MLVRLYYLIMFVALCVVALGLHGTLSGEQCVKVLLGIIAVIQGTKEIVREKRNGENNGKN